ncbi:EF-hand calcium-binding domain-containing protein 4A [Galendromus occidentalis]|uniref:EF-hand calcium-binding domain-containing protein 4A n=1 Tax=Galendromus occidentalis TaxID=34638 RepID=A0AAJ7L3V6_9ACAR|nr:EF-hand calcium-binding domain-containing protein 4A [Galendromus occidentalis]
MDVGLRPMPSSNPGSASGGSELRELLIDKARELFEFCDTENKGFITKRCMQRLKGQIPLEPDQLEEVFNRLDVDGNGFLTLEEFTDGFGMFMGIDTRPRKMSCTQEEMLEAFGDFRSRARRVSSVEEIDEIDEEDSKFEEFLDSLGAHQLFKDEDYVRMMWSHLSKENPSMLQNFEEFLTKVTGNIKETEKECSSLESALISRKMQQDEEVQKLYEEMESQLKQEKERALREERKRQDRLRGELASELQTKDRILQELMSKHCELEERFNDINCSETDIKLRNARLEKERDTLEKRLNETEIVVQKMQNYMETLRQQSLDEKRARAQSALQASESMALERGNLIKQLEMLRTMNKQLLDQKDEINLLLREKKEASAADAEERRSDYFSIEGEDVSLVSQGSARSSQGSFRRSPRYEGNNPFLQQQRPNPNVTANEFKTTRTLVHPERLFKVVIVGDSAVGKSSLINRFCQGQFVPSFNATIGVDFRVKSVTVEGRPVALQLWDTAGQERFRSITKQYFRKADGVIIVYDVTSEESFKNVRAWVSALQDGVTDEIALMIVGNKADMDTALRMVSFSTGQKLAHEYEAIFHETSAKTGQGIDPAMEHLASLLRVKEDEEIEKAVNLQGETPSKRCC